MLKILLIDDNPDDRVLIIRELTREFGDVEIDQVSTPEDFHAALERGRYDIAVTDYHLGWINGIDVLRRLKGQWPEMPVIMFTGTGSEEIAVEAMKEGLDDYVLKTPKHYIRLAVSVKAALQRARERSRFHVLEQRYRQLFNNLPICVYRTTVEGEWIEMNSSGLRLFGFSSPDELKKSRSADLYCDQEERKKLLDILLRKEQVSGWRTRLYKWDGSCFWAELHSNLIRDERGEPLYIDGIIEDIDRLVSAEEALKKMVSYLDTIVDHMPEGVALVEHDGRIALANPMADEFLRAITGVSTGEVLTDIAGRPLEEFLVTPPNFMWHSVVIEGPAQRLFEIAARAVSGSTGKSGIVLVIRDVTKEKESEERMQSQERLAAVGQLAAGIAHDFNNILTGIIGYAEILLLDRNLDAMKRQRIEAILHNGQRAAQLIRQILDFSRKSISAMKPFDLKAFLKEFIKFIERAIPENIQIMFECDGDDFIINGDATKIQQVLANLAVNAKDAMPQGGRLSFRLQRTSIPGDRQGPLPEMNAGEWIMLTVSDTGAGIQPDVLSHIFEPFYTTKPAGKGTGLGLSQVYGIVKQHNGFIDVRSEPGRGSDFILYFPCIEQGHEVAPGEPRGEIKGGHGEKILVVEDNEPVLLLVKTVLDELGYSVVAASNGSEAIEIFDASGKDIRLVITDVVMPEMSGMDLSAILKERNPDIRIIALSGYPLGIDEDTMRKSGIIQWIQKPIEVKSFAEAVRQALSGPGVDGYDIP